MVSMIVPLPRLAGTRCCHHKSVRTTLYERVEDRNLREDVSVLSEGIKACGFFCWALCASLLASCMVTVFVIKT